MVALERPICPVLGWARVQDGVYCGHRKPLFDGRTFVYGWEVYRVYPVRELAATRDYADE